MTDDLFPERERSAQLVAATEESPLFRLIMDVRRRYAPRNTAWTGLAGNSSRDMTAQWLSALGDFTVDDVAEALDLHMQGTSGQFFPSLTQVVDLASGLVRAREAGARTEYVASTSGWCNGNGWIEQDEGGSIPCGRCNPVLRMVFNDRRKWAQYLNGTPLHLLGVGVEKKHGMLVWDAQMPERCRPAHKGQLFTESEWADR